MYYVDLSDFVQHIVQITDFTLSILKLILYDNIVIKFK